MSPLPAFPGWVGALLGELALFGGALLSLASVLSLYHGWKQRQMAEILAETPQSRIRDVRSPGVVRVRGTVVPESETFTSPIRGDEESVLAAWKVEERYDTPKSNSWEDSAWGVTSVPFFVADDTGRLLVDVEDTTVGNLTDDVFTPESILVSDGVSVEGLRCEFESFDVRVETGMGEDPPERVAEFVDATDGLSREPMATDLVVDESERKYRAQTLRAGDEVSVLGYASPRKPDADPDAVSSPENLVVSQSDESVLFLSTPGFDDVAGGGGGLLFGLLTGVVGAALLAAAFLL